MALCAGSFTTQEYPSSGECLGTEGTPRAVRPPSGQQPSDGLQESLRPSVRLLPAGPQGQAGRALQERQRLAGPAPGALGIDAHNFPSLQESQRDVDSPDVRGVPADREPAE